MPHVRRDVWKLSATDKTLEWYGRAVEELQKRPITDATSWWSLGAIHGIHPQIWQNFGFITATTPMPPTNVQDILWNQCQHMTWYFLPWHRGYLGAFEQIVRDAVVKLGGPADWALPYWNYTDDPNALELPKAFANATLPGGGKNFLHVTRRYGLAVFPATQNPILMPSQVAEAASSLQELFFEGVATGGSAGFGGIKTPFMHSADDGTFGVLESQPHNGVHVVVGGGFAPNGQVSTNPLQWGLMTNPDTAALDPIFWLHHANIDRLWSVWLRQKPQPGDPEDAFTNPADTDWLDGPADRKFTLPRVDGTLFEFTSRQMLDTTAPLLDYIYDDEQTAPVPVENLAVRFERLGAPRAAARELAGAVTMAPAKTAELLGANSGAVRLNSDVVEARVRLDSGQREKLRGSLNVRTLATEATPRTPDRVYLNLENIKSPSDAALFYVYVNLPEGADHEKYKDRFAGTVSMFGVSKATKSGSGNGVNASFDITSIVDKMHAANTLGDDISVKLVSAVPGATSDDISVGRISVYRQGQ